MKEIVRNEVTAHDLQEVWEQTFFNWEELRGKTFFVTGATGILGSFLVRCLLNANEQGKLQMQVIASVRDIKKAENLYARELEQHKDSLRWHIGDVSEEIRYFGRVNYIIHAACPTESSFFVEHPQATRNIIEIGTRNVLEFAHEKAVDSMVYLSSMEALGQITENRLLSEDDEGSIDEKNPRNSYPAAKRRAEKLCKMYAREHDVPVRIARLSQVIGACANWDDCRVYGYFARCVITKSEIELRTSGNSLMSSCYISDVMRALPLLTLRGVTGEVYQIAHEKSANRIIDVARILEKKHSDIRVRIHPQQENHYVEGVSWNMSTEKIRSLGWRAEVSLEEAYNRLINSFREQLTASSRQKHPNDN